MYRSEQSQRRRKRETAKTRNDQKRVKKHTKTPIQRCNKDQLLCKTPVTEKRETTKNNDRLEDTPYKHVKLLSQKPGHLLVSWPKLMH
jgi:hypothetical protein